MEVLEVVEIAMNNRNGCKEKYPHMQMDEHCEFQNQLFFYFDHKTRQAKLKFFPDEIKINSPDEPKRARIIAFSVWGILRSYTVGFLFLSFSLSLSLTVSLSLPLFLPLSLSIFVCFCQYIRESGLPKS